MRVPSVGAGDQVHGGGVGVAQPEQDVLVERVRSVGVARGAGEGQHVGDLRRGASRSLRVTWSLVGSALLIPPTVVRCRVVDARTVAE